MGCVGCWEISPVKRAVAAFEAVWSARRWAWAAFCVWFYTRCVETHFVSESSIFDACFEHALFAMILLSMFWAHFVRGFLSMF